jgi:hypothetical protein
MERQKIFPVLFAVILAAAVFLGVYFFVIYRNINYLPDEALDDLCQILEEDGILLDKNLVPLKKETGTVYVSADGEYASSTAMKLGESNIKYRFAVPDGEVILLENGGMCEFRSDFYFRYRLDREKEYTDGTIADGYDGSMTPMHPDAASKPCETAKAFLEKGSSEFDKQPFRLATEVNRVWEKDGIYYVECVRTIDGEIIKGNRTVCVVSEGLVIEAVGTWCFPGMGESYFSQLTDIFNILFSVKKEIDGLRESEDVGKVSVKAIDRCYTLYDLGADRGICFIPCWRIVTDVCGIFIYNAVDGTLCTE